MRVSYRKGVFSASRPGLAAWERSEVQALLPEFRDATLIEDSSSGPDDSFFRR